MDNTKFRDVKKWPWFFIFMFTGLIVAVLVGIFTQSAALIFIILAVSVAIGGVVQYYVSGQNIVRKQTKEAQASRMTKEEKQAMLHPNSKKRKKKKK